MKSTPGVLIFLLTTITAEKSMTLVEKAGKLLQIFEGTVTEVSCSTTTPGFFINEIFTSRHYDQLPDLFGIEARVAPDRSNVTLRINGTSLIDNVTIECQNIPYPVIGHTETLFRCTMVFIDKLPSPTNAHLNESALYWAPPTQFQSLSNTSTISIDFHITHYMVYITDLSTNFKINVISQHPNFTYPCAYSVQVSAVNSAGEGERTNKSTINNCADADASGAVTDKSGKTESDYYHNHVYDQPITLIGSDYESKTEKFHSAPLTTMIGVTVLTGSIASVSLLFNCVLLIVLMKKLGKQKSKNDNSSGKCEQRVVIEQNEAYACAASLNTCTN